MDRNTQNISNDLLIQVETLKSELEQEIDKRKQAENVLRESKARDRLIFRNSPIGILFYDQNGEVTRMNPKAEEIYNLPPGAAVGFNLLHQNQQNGVLKGVRDSLSGNPGYYEGEFTTSLSGKFFFKRAHYNPVYSDNNEIVGGICMVEDITQEFKAREALAKNEEKFRMLAENSVDSIFELDLEGFHQYVSSATTKIFGYTVEETIGSHFSRYLPETKLQEAYEVFGKVLCGESIRSYESEAIRKDGRTIIAEFSIAPIRKNGQIIGFQGLTRDVTARKTAENALKESHAKLHQLTKYLQTVRENERTMISRELHDELGQVMTAINMEASWVAKKIPNSLNTLKPRVEAISELSVGAIRSVKRIISKLRPTLLTDLGLTAAIKWEAKEYQHRTGISFEVNIAPDEFEVNEDLGITVFRIFQEATTNVIRHAGATLVRVNLKKKSDAVELIVKDNGLGFSGEDILLNESFGILGMRERAEMRGGILEIVSKPKKGTTLVSRLPL